MEGIKEVTERVMAKLNNKDFMKKRNDRIEREKKEAVFEETIKNFLESGIPKENYKLPFSKIKPRSEKQQKLLSLLAKWIRGKERSLPYIYGTNGTGKSFISKSFGVTLIRKNISDVKWVLLSSFMIKYRGWAHEELAESLVRPSVLILDDFCAHNTTKQVTEVLHSVLSIRLEQKKNTLITSNVPINNVSRALYDSGKNSGVPFHICEAIEDRLFKLCNGALFFLDGESFRVKDALERYK